MGASGFSWFNLSTLHHTPSWGEVSLASGYRSAKIDEVVNVVILFVIAVSTHVSPHDVAFCEKYGIEAVDFGCEFPSVEGRSV